MTAKRTRVGKTLLELYPIRNVSTYHNKTCTYDMYVLYVRSTLRLSHGSPPNAVLSVHHTEKRRQKVRRVTREESERVGREE